jgi:peptidoglycan pentaglycine glycine transferase (the first glycine)
MTPDAWDGDLGRLACPPPLLQSWGHGEVQAREGWCVERVVLPGAARATVLVQGAGAVRWGYVPRGPVPPTEAAVADLVSWARERRVARLRVEPEAPPEFGRALSSLGFEPAPDTQPRHTLLVPLASEEEMLASFRPKHRYNVRLALKRGVEVTEGDEADELVRHTEATARRKGISQPRLEQFRERLARLAWCRVYVARHRGRSLAAILVARFGGRAYYLFGGATGEGNELKPSYAVQWAAMRAAAVAGCRDYDLWGVPPAPDPSHPWFGLWQIKTGFGGRLVEYCGAWELVLSPFGAALGRTALALRRAARRFFT